jgi:hypothetical protein
MTGGGGRGAMKKAAMSSFLIAVTLLAVAVTIEAQQPKKVTLCQIA